MDDIAIRAEGISKKYSIGERKVRYRTFRDQFITAMKAPFNQIRSAYQHRNKADSNANNSIWALQDVSFEVKRGEVVGVIGRNGAGKSTLLKILSRITEPTSGLAEIHGRVGSLLEVGTGFHHELTGRENVYLNGAILGMKREVIERRFDEIVEFAEVGKFIDTQIKHYSSGMHLRLAFSVAAHLEPEILLIDEILAVGDLPFQKKCLGKMDDVAAQGRTVLFVSHNLGVIKELCQTAIVLNNGMVEFRGPVVEGLTHYSQGLSENLCTKSLNGTGWRNVRINGQPNGLASSITGEKPIFTETWFDFSEPFAYGYLFCIINNSIGDTVVHQRVKSDELGECHLYPGRYKLRVELPPLWLAPGVYTLYFKFIGRKPSGAEERHFSERVILDVTGSMNGASHANLVPPINWTFSPDPVMGTHGASQQMNNARVG